MDDLVDSGRAFQSLIEEGKKEFEENVLQGLVENCGGNIAE